MPSGIYPRRGGKTRGQRELIRGLRAKGTPAAVLAERFGVHPQTVYKIASGEWNPGRRKSQKTGSICRVSEYNESSPGGVGRAAETLSESNLIGGASA